MDLITSEDEIWVRGPIVSTGATDGDGWLHTGDLGGFDDRGRLMRMGGIKNICFSTDYPPWDNDMPMQSRRALNTADRDRIMRRNARDVLRLPAPEVRP